MVIREMINEGYKIFNLQCYMANIHILPQLRYSQRNLQDVKQSYNRYGASFIIFYQFKQLETITTTFQKFRASGFVYANTCTHKHMCIHNML